MTGLHVVKKTTRSGVRWYVYAWRGGPCIHTADGPRPKITQPILDAAASERRAASAAPPDRLAWLISEYKSSPEYKRLGDRTRTEYARWLDRITDRFGNTPIEVFEDKRVRRDIIVWRNKWEHQPRSADSAATMMSTLLGWGVSQGHISVNRAHGIPNLHSVNRADIIWEEQHWAAIRPHASAELMQALRLDSMTGFRLSDLVALKWEHVGENAIVFVTAKRKRRVVVPIFDELRAFLATLKRDDSTILKNSRGQKWTASGLGTVYQKAKTKAGIDVHIHDLRGTYVTWLAKNRLTDEEIARIVGWSPKRVSEIRSRYVDEQAVVVSLVERLKAG